MRTGARFCRRWFSSPGLVSHPLSSFPCVAQVGFLGPSLLAWVTCLQYMTMPCLNRGQRETAPPPTPAPRSLGNHSGL